MGRLIRYPDPWLTAMLLVIALAAYEVGGVTPSPPPVLDRVLAVQARVVAFPLRVVTNAELQRVAMRSVVEYRARRLWGRVRPRPKKSEDIDNKIH